MLPLSLELESDFLKLKLRQTKTEANNEPLNELIANKSIPVNNFEAQLQLMAQCLVYFGSNERCSSF